MAHRWRVRCLLSLFLNAKRLRDLLQLRFRHTRNKDLLDLVKRSVGSFRSDLLAEPRHDGVHRLTGLDSTVDPREDRSHQRMDL